MRDNLKRLVDYAGNPEKTEYTDLRQELNYVGRASKTQDDSERLFYVSGLNCDAANAYEDMTAVKRHFGKTDGNLAYHAYQSFKPGEVTPEQCHEIGVELAKVLWGSNYQVLVATHLDRAHLHNHFLINSVSFMDGRKFNDDKAAYRRMRAVSDELCREHGLSTIKNPKGKTPRSLYFAEKNGAPTRYNLMREAVDTALARSSTVEGFRTVLREQGYEFSAEPNRKYITLKRTGAKKAVRLYHLGEDYDISGIQRRLDENYERYGADLLWQTRRREAVPQTPVKHYRVRGALTGTKKIGGLRGLYLRYCYELGILPKNSHHRPLSPEMREECRRLDEISRQAQLIAGEKFKTVDDVSAFLTARRVLEADLMEARKKCYNRLRRCQDPHTAEEIKQERDWLTKALAQSRPDMKTAEKIIERAKVMPQNLQIEQEMKAARHQRDAIQRRNTHERSYER